MVVHSDFNSFYCGRLPKIKSNVKEERGGAGKVLWQDKKNEWQCEREG